MKGAILLAVVCGAMGGCFKPALDREVDVEPDLSETTDSDIDLSEITDSDVDHDVAETDTTVEVVECQGASGQPCDDGNPCTRDDRCGTRGCEGIPYTCDDGLSCTEDRCDGAGGCTYPLANGACLIGGTCVAAGQVKADDPCRVCAGGQAWSPNDGGACEDGDTVCTLGDTCAGLVCVGGPRPSDAATDWALRPLAAVTPAMSSVVGIGRAVLDPLIVVQGAGGPTTLVTTAGDRAVAGRSSVGVLRRSPSGVIPLLVLEGFDVASVDAFAPNFSQNEVMLAIRREGAGWMEDSSGARTEVSGVGHRLISLDTMTSGVIYDRAWNHRVESAALKKGGGGAVIMSDFGGNFVVEELPELQFSNVGPQDQVVTSMSRTGDVLWGVHVASDDFLGTGHVCTTPSGGVVVSTAFTGMVDVSASSGTTRVVSSSPYATYLLIWIDSNGLVSQAVAPFAFVSDPEIDGTILAGPAIMKCTDTHVTLLLNGELAESRELGIHSVSPGAVSGAYSMTRLSPDGTILWSMLYSAIAPTSVFERPGNGMLVGWAGSGVNAAITDSFATMIPVSGSTGILSVDDHGQVEWLHVLARDATLSIIRGIIQLPQRGIVVGGMTAYVPAPFHGADSVMTLPFESDISGFVLGLGTNNGLTCEHR